MGPWRTTRFIAITFGAMGWALACGTAGAPEPGAPAARGKGAICGLDERVRSALSLRDDSVRPTEVVLRVLDAQDRAVPDLALMLKGSTEVTGALECTARTDRYGVARVRLVSALYKLSLVGRPDMVARTGTFYSGSQDPKEIRIERAGAISGRVVDERGKPIRATVLISGEDGLCGGQTDDQGGFRCDSLWSGEHSVTATVEDRAPVSRTVMLAPGQDLRDVTLTPLPGGVLVVRATCGGPCVGATVAASIGDEVREEQVGADGIARLRDLPAGEVRIYGFRDDPRGGKLRAKALGVMVQAGRTVTTTLELARKRN
jgi:hypothetical protein